MRIENIVLFQLSSIDAVDLMHQVLHARGFKELFNLGGVRGRSMVRSYGCIARCCKFEIIFVDDARGAGSEAKAAAAENDRRRKIGRGVGDVMVEPEGAVGVVGEIGNDVAAANLDQTILHELGLDVEIVVDFFKFRDECAAH